MRLTLLALALISLAAALSADPALEFAEEPWGRVAIAPLESAPYPHPSRDEGFAGRRTFYPRDPHYIDSSVGFLVPRGYEARETVDIIVHFHGHGNNLRRLIPLFELGEQLEASGRNAILIVPQGPHDAGDSRNGKIDEPGGFTALIEESLALLRAAGVTRTEQPGRIVIMGHSGGYYTLGQIIANGDLAAHIAELYVWDAAYAQIEHFADFAARPDTRVVSIFTGHLAEENVDLLSDLQGRGIACALLHDSQVTDEVLRAERLLLMHTDLGHNNVMHETRHLERWLRTSTLSARGGGQ